MRLRFLSYRYAEAVLDASEFSAMKAEILEILLAAPIPLLDPSPTARRGTKVKTRRRDPKAGSVRNRYFFLPVDQKAINAYLDGEFRLRGWSVHPPIIPVGSTGGPQTRLAADYKKGKLQVEVQFGNMARWYTDVFKFQLSYSREEIDAAVLVVPVQRLANLIDENVAYFERVERELPWAKMSLTLPIWVIGIEPDDWAPVEVIYTEAAELFRQSKAADGEDIEPIRFDHRVAEEPEEMADFDD